MVQTEKPIFYDQEHSIPAIPAVVRGESQLLKTQLSRGYASVAGEEAQKAAERDLRRAESKPGWTLPRIIAMGLVCLAASGVANKFIGTSDGSKTPSVASAANR
jgi:hypothetical protein